MDERIIDERASGNESEPMACNAGEQIYRTGGITDTAKKRERVGGKMPRKRVEILTMEQAKLNRKTQGMQYTTIKSLRSSVFGFVELATCGLQALKSVDRDNPEAMREQIDGIIESGGIWLGTLQRQYTRDAEEAESVYQANGPLGKLAQEFLSGCSERLPAPGRTKV